MSLPVTDLLGHLMWTKDGAVWATWRMSAMSWAGTIEDKKAVAGAHRLLTRSLGGEPLFFSSVMPEDPASTVDRMIEGVDLAQAPMWVAECEATLDLLDDLAVGERFFWLAMPLANRGKQAWTQPLRSAWRSLKDQLQLPVDRPIDAEQAARLYQASQIEASIPAPFKPVRVPVAEQMWISSHAQRRGQLDLPVPVEGSVSQDMIRTGACLTEPVLDEGARSDVDGPSRVNVLRQRVLKVMDPSGHDVHGFQPSYQALMAMAGTPAGGMEFPGSEWLFSLDQTGIDVDWAIRTKINAHELVLDRNRKAVRKLNEQYSHREAEESTGQHDLNLIADQLTEYAQIFSNDPQEVEVEHTIILAVSATATSEDEPDSMVNDRCQSQADTLAKVIYESTGIKLERPPGHQVDLWWAMQPGAPASPVVRRLYAQITTSDHFGKLVPFVDVRLGGRRGPVVFLSEATARPRPVHLDIAGYPQLDVGGDVAVIAEKGSGKSVFQKTVCAHLVARGGQFLAIDKSEDGEWEKFAAALGSAQVVQAIEPSLSVDPVRLFGPVRGGELLQRFLVPLLGVDTDDGKGSLLAQVLSADYLDRHEITTSTAVVEHFEALAADTVVDGPRYPDREAAQWLAPRVRQWSERQLGAVVFDPDLPLVDLTAAGIVWRTQGMEQPNADEILQPHLFSQMSPEKKFGRAYYGLIIKISREIASADPSQEVAIVLDEVNDVTENPENVRDIQHIVRRGRRLKAFVIVGGHDVGDLRDDVLMGLIGTRVLMRQRDETLAKRGVRWLGIREDDPQFNDMVKRVTEDLSPLEGDQGVAANRRGECYLRDVFGGLGLARVLPPANPALREAVLTTPPKRKAHA